jgi:phosphatidylglycerol:prolipoprotein diacylglycerol transferase
VHPIAFQLGSLPVRWYGVMMALGFLAGLWTATRRARRANVSGDVIADVTLWLMFGSIAGARAVYVVTYWKQEFASQPFSEIFMVQHGGLVFYGGLIGATIAGSIYLAWKKLPVWKIADILAPSIALGSVFGRLGCLMNGCCYGYPCDLPWAIHFPADHATAGVAVHPTQIYDALLNLILYLLLAWGFRYKKFDGQIFAAYLMGYALFRSLAEHFRGDYPADHIHNGLTSAQVLSVIIFSAGVALWIWRARGVQKNENRK